MIKYLFGAIAIFAIAGGATYYFFIHQPSTSDERERAALFSGLEGIDRELPDRESEFMTFALASGSLISVPNFLAVEQPSWASDSAGYLVAGDPAGDFLITYVPEPIATDEGDGNQHLFVMTLFASPLAQTRERASSELLTKLQLGVEQLCQLDVGTYVFTEEQNELAGKDVGLSYCADATPLP